MSAFQRAQMYSLPDANIFNIAVNRHVRRRPGHREGRLQRRRLQGQVQDRRRQFDQLGAGGGPDRLLLPGLLPGHQVQRRAGGLRRALGQFRQYLRRPYRPHDGPAHRPLVLATNENDVLDEFFRTGVYRPRTAAETSVTSSPSMDISKASNFERFRLRSGGRDPPVVRELWAKVDKGEAFDLSATPHWAKMPEFGFVSGQSSHADRLQDHPLRCPRTYGVMLDTHTADGLKVARKTAPASPWSSWNRPTCQVRRNHPRGPGPEPLRRTTSSASKICPNVGGGDGAGRLAAVKRFIAERV